MALHVMVAGFSQSRNFVVAQRRFRTIVATFSVPSYQLRRFYDICDTSGV